MYFIVSVTRSFITKYSNDVHDFRYIQLYAGIIQEQQIQVGLSTIQIL